MYIGVKFYMNNVFFCKQLLNDTKETSVQIVLNKFQIPGGNLLVLKYETIKFDKHPGYNWCNEDRPTLRN